MSELTDGPVLGQLWLTGGDPRFGWLVDGVGLSSGLVYLTLHRRGDGAAWTTTGSRMEWPRNRWGVFVERERLVLDRSAASG